MPPPLTITGAGFTLQGEALFLRQMDGHVQVGNVNLIEAIHDRFPGTDLGELRITVEQIEPPVDENFDEWQTKKP